MTDNLGSTTDGQGGSPDGSTRDRLASLNGRNENPIFFKRFNRIRIVVTISDNYTFTRKRKKKNTQKFCFDACGGSRRFSLGWGGGGRGGRGNLSVIHAVSAVQEWNERQPPRRLLAALSIDDIIKAVS